MASTEEQISEELIRFSDDAARARFQQIRVPPRASSIEDVYGKKHEVLTVAEVGEVQILLRLTDRSDRWGFLSEGHPAADFNWYETLWDAFLAAGMWPVPQGHVFE